jgi:hypothetical protein
MTDTDAVAAARIGQAREAAWHHVRGYEERAMAGGR